MPEENGNKTFVQITNRMIYDKIDCMEKKVDKIINDVEKNRDNIRLNRKIIMWLWFGLGSIAISIITAAITGVI